MLFNSFAFLILLLVTFGLYYAPFLRRRQVEILVISSFVFYAWEMPVLLTLLLFSITINAVTSHMVFFGKPERRKFYSTLGVVVNLAVLAFFKYSPLVGHTFFPDPASDFGRFLISIPLPIGISFFTFHGISLLYDVYRGKRIEEYAHLISRSFWTHWLVTSLYIAFFPQLVSGPIVKSYGFLPQVKEKFLRDIRWRLAFEQIILGYFFKMVVADNLKDHTFWIAYPHFENLDSLTLFMLLIGYSMQIFADFAGYSLIALGLAELFCYTLPDNFHFPYISRTFAEFWKRWHISLSSWLQEYLYIGLLGGNRKGKVRTYVNLFATMFLGGLWHGAAWSYAVWGSFHGLALAVERILGQYIHLPKDNKIVQAFQMLIVFLFVTLAWLLFKLPDFSQAVGYVKAMFAGTGRRDMNIIFYVALYSIPVVLYHLDYLIKPQGERHGVFRYWQPAVYAVLLFLIATNSGTAGDFIYFQF